jgi:hypothetical protein
VPRLDNITYDDLMRLILDSAAEDAKRIVAGVVVTDPGDEADFHNPMTGWGDLIYGGESGAPRRRAIGTEGQILAVALVSGNLVPVWVDGAGAVGQYRTLLYELDGSGGFEFLTDLDGHPLYELAELE